MSTKNLSRKGLALGTALTLGLSGLFGLPANANTSAVGLELATTTATGPVSYAVTSEDTLKIRADFKHITADATAGQFVKFLVEDAAAASSNFVVEAVSPAYSAATSSSSTANAVWTTDANGVLTVNLLSGHRFRDGDVVTLSATGADSNTALGGKTLTVTGTSPATVTGTLSGTSLGTDGNEAVATTVTLTLSAASHKEAATNGSYVVNTRQAVPDSFYQLWLSSTSDDSKTVNVTSWVDTNVTSGTAGQGVNVIDPTTEFKSATRTLEFWAASDLTVSLDFKQPVLGQATLIADVTTTPVLNFEQVAPANQPWVSFTRQDSDYVSKKADVAITRPTGSGVFRSTVQLNDTDWDTANVATPPSVVSAGQYTARAYFQNPGLTGNVNLDALTAAASLLVAAAATADIEATTTASDNVQPGFSTTKATATNVDVRLGTASVDVNVQLYDATGAKLGAGRTVVASGVAAGFKVNGADSTALVLTDANGVAKFTISKTAATVAGNTGDIQFIAENKTADAEAAAIRLTWVAASYSLKDLNGTGSAVDGTRSINAGGSLAINAIYSDQWRVAAPAATYRLQVQNSGRTTSPQSATYTSFPAAFTVVDNATGVGSTITTVMTPQRLIAGVWTNQTATTVTTNVLNQSDAVTGAQVTLTGAISEERTADIAQKTTVAEDMRVKQGAATTYTAAALGVAAYNDAEATVSGVVGHAVTSVARPFATVTVSGDSSLLFRNGEVSSFGSITVVAGANGAFSVDVFSNKATAAAEVTITSGTASAKTRVAFRAARAEAGKQLTLTVPPTSLAGATVRVSAKLVDAWGNPVASTQAAGGTSPSSVRVGVTYTGPGVIVGNLPDRTDANGDLSFTVLIGSNDLGTATATVSYASDASFSGLVPTGHTRTTKQGTLVIGNNAPAPAFWTSKKSDGTVKVYAKNIVRQGKVEFRVNGKEIAWVRAVDANDPKLRFAGDAYYLVRTVELVDNRKNVFEIYVDGKRVKRAAYSG